jgi:hypothetical protein
MIDRYEYAHQNEETEQQQYGIDEHTLVAELAYVNERIGIEVGFAAAPERYQQIAERIDQPEKAIAQQQMEAGNEEQPVQRA